MINWFVRCKFELKLKKLSFDLPGDTLEYCWVKAECKIDFGGDKDPLMEDVVESGRTLLLDRRLPRLNCNCLMDGWPFVPVPLVWTCWDAGSDDPK